MIRYIVVSVGSGILFGLLDGLINANPLAKRLFKAFEPIARKSVSIPVGVAIRPCVRLCHGRDISSAPQKPTR
jgi:hypothetical protein